jgi:hypothetical protein
LHAAQPKPLKVDTGKPPMNWRQYQDLLAKGKIQAIEPPKHV